MAKLEKRNIKKEDGSNEPIYPETVVKAVKKDTVSNITLDAILEWKLDKIPQGTTPLINGSTGKINEEYFPSMVLDGLKFGGSFSFYPATNQYVVVSTPYPNLAGLDLNTALTKPLKSFYFIANGSFYFKNIMYNAGDWAICNGDYDNSGTNTIQDWTHAAQTNKVSSVQGINTGYPKVGNVVLTPEDLGLDDTRDEEKVVKGAIEDGDGNLISSAYAKTEAVNVLQSRTLLLGNNSGRITLNESTNSAMLSLTIDDGSFLGTFDEIPVGVNFVVTITSDSFIITDPKKVYVTVEYRTGLFTPSLFLTSESSYVAGMKNNMGNYTALFNPEDKVIFCKSEESKLLIIANITQNRFYSAQARHSSTHVRPLEIDLYDTTDIQLLKLQKQIEYLKENGTPEILPEIKLTKRVVWASETPGLNQNSYDFLALEIKTHSITNLMQEALDNNGKVFLRISRYKKGNHSGNYNKKTDYVYPTHYPESQDIFRNQSIEDRGGYIGAGAVLNDRSDIVDSQERMLFPQEWWINEGGSVRFSERGVVPTQFNITQDNIRVWNETLNSKGILFKIDFLWDILRNMLFLKIQDGLDLLVAGLEPRIDIGGNHHGLLYSSSSMTPSEFIEKLCFLSGKQSNPIPKIQLDDPVGTRVGYVQIKNFDGLTYDSFQYDRKLCGQTTMAIQLCVVTESTDAKKKVIFGTPKTFKVGFEYLYNSNEIHTPTLYHYVLPILKFEK